MERIRQQIELIEGHIKRIREVLDSLTPSLPDESQKKLEEGFCLSCGKTLKGKKAPSVRGNHASCYRKLKRAMDEGRITDAAAVASGRLAPKKAGGRPPNDEAVQSVIDQMSKAIPAPETKQAKTKKATNKGQP
jgi:hypothetical protein